VEGQPSELGACERERAAGNAGSANGTKNPPNYCKFLEHGGGSKQNIMLETRKNKLPL